MAAQDAADHGNHSSVDSDEWFPCHAATSSDLASGKYRVNKRGRVILVTREEREIVVCAVKKTVGVGGESAYDVFAYDRNCYHVGYPMDMGDIEDLHVSCGGNVTEFHVVCITCPLHNRIFDIRTGDLVTVSHAQPQQSPACIVTAGRRKGGAPSSHGCHQRVHPVELEITDEGQRIVVFDTYALHSGFNESTQSRSLDVLCAGKVLSDKYNPPGAVEDFKEFNPQKGNSFLTFRPPVVERQDCNATKSTPPDITDNGATHHSTHDRKCCSIL